MTRPGELFHRLTLYEPVRADDGSGGFTRSNTSRGIVWAGLRVASAREIEAAGRLEMQVTHKASLRYRADIEPKQGWNVTWTDRRGTLRSAYVLAAADPNERGRWLTLDLREGGAT